MLNPIACIIFSLALLPFNSGEPDIYFSGSFQNTPFEQFVIEVEMQSGAHFYFLEEWVSGITITAAGNNLSLSGILQKHLYDKGLYFCIDDKKNVFITSDLELISNLPDYQSYNEYYKPDEQSGSKELTQIEKKYIEGKIIGTAETIIVGKENGDNIHGKAGINGKLWDVESGESIIGATIYIEEIETGTVSDINGQFSLILEPGKYSVIISCLGMKEVRYFLQVYSNGQMNIAMEKKIIPISEVVVKSDQFQNVRGMQMGFEKLDINTIKEIPVVFGEKDLLKVVQLLPGIQSVGEGSSGINVRGSPADQNMFYINKVPVYNPSHLFGFFSAFSPDIIKDFSFYKSNVPAKYGGRLASFFDISTKQGNNKKFSARGGISPVTGHIAIEGPLRKEHSSFIISARSTYSDWLLSRLEDPDLRNSDAAFHDFTANINSELNQNNHLKGFYYYSYDRFSLASINKYQYSNMGGSLDWQHRISSTLSADLAAVFSNYSYKAIDNIFPPMAYNQKYHLNHYEFKTDLIWYPGQKHTMTFGGNSILYDLIRGDILPSGTESLRVPVSLGNETGIEGAVYISDEIKLLPRLTIYGGIRYSFYGLLGPGTVYEYYPDGPENKQNIRDSLIFKQGQIIQTYSGPEIRGAINLGTGANSSLKISYNRIRQYLFMLSNTIAISPTDQWKLCDYHIKPPYSAQISAGFYKDFLQTDLNTSIEVYYKRIHNIVDFKDDASLLTTPNIETELLQGTQSAYGIEMMVKKNTGKLNGWISYAYSRSEILVNGESSWEKINSGYPYLANYDKPHAFNLVMNYRTNRRLSFSGILVYSTGRPVTYPLSIYYINGQPFVKYSLRNEYRIPDYFRIDCSINFEGTLRAKKIAHSYWMINIYNLTGRENAYSVFFKSEDGKINGYKLSVFSTPIVTISWNFKLGNYASE
jgi:hypothetical protein